MILSLPETGVLGGILNLRVKAGSSKMALRRLALAIP